MTFEINTRLDGLAAGLTGVVDVDDPYDALDERGSILLGLLDGDPMPEGVEHPDFKDLNKLIAAVEAAWEADTVDYERLQAVRTDRDYGNPWAKTIWDT